MVLAWFAGCFEDELLGGMVDGSGPLQLVRGGDLEVVQDALDKSGQVLCGRPFCWLVGAPPGCCRVAAGGLGGGAGGGENLAGRDYIAEVLKSMRDQDYSDRYMQHFTLSSDISTRDRDGIHKTFSGLMKILYPHGEATPEEIEEILRFAIEGRKRVKDQILRIDSTMTQVKFGYLDTGGVWHPVSTLEEDEYPAYYHRERRDGAETPDDGGEPTPGGSASGGEAEAPLEPEPVAEPPLFEGHREFQENQRGVSFDTLFVPYLRGAAQITITDPYIRQFHQARNLMELIEGIAATKDAADEVNVKLITSENSDGEEKLRKQLELLVKIKQGAAAGGINFDVSFDDTIHDRSIVADTGWKILLGRGLDVFQYVTGDAFDLATKLQEYRHVKAFGVTYIREDGPPPL
jgi:ATP-dependent Lon protease